MEVIRMLAPDTPDRELLTRLKARDPVALTEAVQDNARPLFRMAVSMGFNATEAEDLVQDVFTVFLSSLDRFEGRAKLRTWLFGILHHKMRERRRSLQREDTYDPVDTAFEALFTAYGHWQRPMEDLEKTRDLKEMGRHIDRCISLLPFQQREVFLLREVEEIDPKEICNHLQITYTHLGVLIHRARHRLRECLKGTGWH